MGPALERLEKVAEALGPLCDQMVFVGGAITELLITDKAMPPPRTTLDVDCTVEVTSRVAYYSLEEKFRQLGFTSDANDPPIMCRWMIQKITVDIMPTLEDILGFSNIWYTDAIKQAQMLTLSGGENIRVITAPWFIATKTEAFISRGKENFFSSHDFEDMLYLVNSRPELIEEIYRAPRHMYNSISERWQSYLKHPDLKGAVQAHVDAYETVSRSAIVIERLEKMFTTGGT